MTPLFHQNLADSLAAAGHTRSEFIRRRLTRGGTWVEGFRVLAISRASAFVKHVGDPCGSADAAAHNAARLARYRDTLLEQGLQIRTVPDKRHGGDMLVVSEQEAA